MLKETVDWPVGSEIVIATTGDKFSMLQSEKVIITAMDSDNKTLTINKPLLNEHLSVMRSVGDSNVNTSVDILIEAEVGLLTRNVVFKGYSDPSWNQFGGDEFGAIITVR